MSIVAKTPLKEPVSRNMGLTDNQGSAAVWRMVRKSVLPLTCWMPRGADMPGRRDGSASDKFNRDAVQAINVRVTPPICSLTGPLGANPWKAPDATNCRSPAGEGKRLSEPTMVRSPPKAVLRSTGKAVEATVRKLPSEVSARRSQGR